MDGDDLHALGRNVVEELPGAEVDYPFGPDCEVSRVRGKVFLLAGFLPAGGGPILPLKVAPEDSRALREAYEWITPGYHMNKQHWVSVHPDPRADRNLVAELVLESYLQVVATLPKAVRPVDPQRYGRRDGA